MVVMGGVAPVSVVDDEWGRVVHCMQNNCVKMEVHGEQMTNQGSPVTLKTGIVVYGSECKTE